jgi:trehalose/maltose transport system permease protein
MNPDKKVSSPLMVRNLIKQPSILLGLILILNGIGALLWLAISIGTNPAISLAINDTQPEASEAPSLVMAFLIDFGIIIPFLAISAGLILSWLGIKAFSGNITVARWAQMILFWLAIGCVIILIFNLYQILSAFSQQSKIESTIIDRGKILVSISLFLLALLFGGFSLWLKQNVERFFHGNEKLKDEEVRFAWNLLIPTIAVLIFVAGRPLEQTFIRSLTDKRFAGQGVPNYVGFDNYKKLLAIRFDTVDCRNDEETGECKLNPNGSIQWETIEKEKLVQGFRAVFTLKLPFFDKPRGLTISGLDRDFTQSIWTTLIFTVISVTLELIIAMFIALTVNSSFKGRGMMRAVMLVPWAIPTAITARLWENMLKSTSAGVINKILMDLHIISEPQAWLSIPDLQIPSAIMVDVWKTAPFVALLLLAGLQTISEDLYEAASVDGASGLQRFFSITLPLLKPTIAVALVFRTLDALRVFDLFNVLFARQQLTMATYNYEMLVGSQKDGYASAISIIIFIFISIFAILYVRLFNVEVE